MERRPVAAGHEGAEEVTDFSRFFNDTVNEYLARGMRLYRAEREAYALAIAGVQTGTVKPPPSDWNDP